MILISLVLVVISAVCLLIGGVFQDGDDLTFVYLSIAAALAAGGFLIAAVLQGSRRRKPIKAAVASGSQDSGTNEATWTGGTWSGEDAAVTREGGPVPTDAQSVAVAAPSGRTAAPPPPPKAPPAPPMPPPTAARQAPGGGPPPPPPAGSAPAAPPGSWGPPRSSPRPGRTDPTPPPPPRA